MTSSTWRIAIDRALFGKARHSQTRPIKARSKVRLTLGFLEDRLAPAGNLVADINTQPNLQGSSPSNLVEFNGDVFFTAFHPTLGRELWMSDGTTAGTSRVRDILQGAGNLNPADLTTFNGVLVFTADGASGY